MHHKKFSLFLLACYANIVFADVAVFNKSSKYDMDITYNFCSGDWSSGDSFVCTQPQSAKIKSNNNTVFKAPSTPPNTTFQYMSILSATQTDRSGKIVAAANYAFEGNEESICDTSTITSTYNAVDGHIVTPYTASHAILLEDSSELPIIMCQSVSYNLVKIN